ncbi:MAG: membrane lipoprotein lipid attachment site-containing protein [Candidatus Moraniibacteriota bacterium]
MKKTIFTLFLLILFTGCSNQQENQATKTEITNNENNLKKESDLAIYYPSEQINKNLKEFSNELSVALFRGDAKSAPTYTETIVKIKK